MSAPMNAIVEIDAVDKHFGALHVLKQVSLSVAAGEVVVVCGPSGSGKSTLLRCVNGLERFDSGDIRIQGLSLRINAAWEGPLSSAVGMVFQAFNLFSHMTVLQNLILAPMKVRGLVRSVAVDLAMRLLTRVGIAEKANDFPATLSGGQQQRVAIARALCMKPQIMLFDEPTSALDPEMIKEVLDVMTDLARDGMTMVVVTHEMGFARQIADLVVFMDAGEIVEQAPPAEFFGGARNARTQTFLRQILTH